MKVLASTTAVGVVASCGYGVVDPLPAPNCFSSPQPTATARIVPAPSGQGADGVVFVEITASFPQTVTLGTPSVTEAIAGGGTGPSLSVVSSEAISGGYRFVVRVPTRVKAFNTTISSSCAAEASGHLFIYATLDSDAGENNVQITGVFAQ